MVASPFPIRDVGTWQLRSDEPGGLEEKEWLAEPSHDDAPSSKLWLFKPVKVNEGWLQGEDWAEKIASEVAACLNVPRADIALATRDGKRGLISRDLRPAGTTPGGGRFRWEMHEGHVLLAEVVDGYQPGSRNVKGRPGHSLENIRRALRDCQAVPGWAGEPSFGAFDVFVGYLVLDALIANQDRHDQNWAVLRHPWERNHDSLAGSYDHASSLGFNLRDQARMRHLERDRLRTFAVRAAAQRFEHEPPQKPKSLVSLARSGFSLVSSNVHRYWLDRLEGLTEDTIMGIVTRVPAMSDVARTFAGELLKINRRRLLDDRE